MRKLITTVLAGGGTLMFSVYLLTAAQVAQQTADATDAGITPNRDATCSVRLDEGYAADAGFGSRVYKRFLFPAALRVLPDAGRDVTLPPMPPGKRQAIDVVDWNDCTLAASTAPVAALWGTARPFTQTGVVSPWCRQKTDAGLPCLLTDGGTFGDRNVTLCTARANPATCERVSGGSIYLGDSPEDL